MATIIDVINKSSVLSNSKMQRLVYAINKQVKQDFAPIWGVSASVRFVKGEPNPKHWWVVILDEADVDGALGYHDLTDDGLPMAKVFAKTIMDYESDLGVVLSHEVLEMLADPGINLLVADGSNKRFYAYEVCDAVEADQFSYKINGVSVSNFVTPDYFELGNTTGPFDFLKMLKKPFPAMLEGGYLAWMDTNGRWHQTVATDKKPSASTRKKLRHKGRDDWQCSCSKHKPHTDADC